jgi:hypothetical protein
MLHRAVLIEMLDDEIAAAQERVGGRVGRIERNGADITVGLGDGLAIRLDGARYDAEPFRVTVTTSQGASSARSPANTSEESGRIG